MAKAKRFHHGGITAWHVDLDFGLAAQAFFEKLLQRFGFVEHLVARHRRLDRNHEFILRKAQARHERSKS